MIAAATNAITRVEGVTRKPAVVIAPPTAMRIRKFVVILPRWRRPVSASSHSASSMSRDTARPRVRSDITAGHK